MPDATSAPTIAGRHSGSRTAGSRPLSAFPIFDSPALIALLAEHAIKPKWATLIQQTLLHHTPQLTRPLPSPPTSAAFLSSLTASSASSHHLPPLDCASVWQSLAERFSSPSSSPPAGLFPLLQSHTALLSSRVSRAETSADGSTTKLLLQLADGQLVESVIMRHRGKETSCGDDDEEAADEQEQEQKEPAVRAARTRRSAGRVTLCVSSQVGCRQACSFCATGTLGLNGSLMAGEIVEQLLHANRVLAAAAAASSSPALSVSNVVFMGQGEPLDNYDAVLESIRCLTSPQLFRLSPARVTVSTVGLTSRILALARDAPHVQLALSLHAPSQSLRLQLVPSSSAYTLPKLLSALQQYIDVTDNTVLIQYILLAGVNSSVSQAEQLTAVLQPLLPRVKVNLIPYNATDAAAGYSAPSREAVLLFQRRVQECGIFCSVRQEMGSDVNGACGQLALKETAAAAAAACGRQQETRGKGEGGVTDIEDLAVQRGGDGVRRRTQLQLATAARQRETERSCENDDQLPIERSSRAPAAAAAAGAKQVADSAGLGAANPVVRWLRWSAVLLSVLLALLLLLLRCMSTPVR